MDRQVLLVKDSRDEWELPGGRIDEGEEHSQTLSREFAEELSIGVALSAPIDSYLFEVTPGRHVFIVTYGCTLVVSFDPPSAVSTPSTACGQLSGCELNLPAGYRRSIEKWANTI